MRPQITFNKLRKPNVGDFVSFTFINSQTFQICYVHMCFFPKIFKKIVFNKVQFFHTFVLNDSQLCQKCHLQIETHDSKFGQILSDHFAFDQKNIKIGHGEITCQICHFDVCVCPKNHQNWSGQISESFVTITFVQSHFFQKCQIYNRALCFFSKTYQKRVKNITSAVWNSLLGGPDHYDLTPKGVVGLRNHCSYFLIKYHDKTSTALIHWRKIPTGPTIVFLEI